MSLALTVETLFQPFTYNFTFASDAVGNYKITCILYAT